METGWVPPVKYDLVVETLIQTHASRRYEKVYYSTMRLLWGRAGQAPKKVQKWLEKAEKVLFLL